MTLAAANDNLAADVVAAPSTDEGSSDDKRNDEERADKGDDQRPHAIIMSNRCNAR